MTNEELWAQSREKDWQCLQSRRGCMHRPWVATSLVVFAVAVTDVGGESSQAA